MTKFLNISTDNTLGGSSASDVLVASQKAVKDYVDQHGGGGSVAIDDTTITQNGDNEIQTVATINANAATGATNPIYDWVGTLAEYETQAVATNHPDWVCYITDDCEATAYQAYTQSQCNNLFVQKGHQVIEFQEPTAANNYTWYRKYADGWVECGMQYAWNGDWTTITLPVAMRDADSYTCTAGGYRTDSSPYQQMTCFRNYTATTVDIWSSDDTTSNPASVRIYISGMAA